MILVTVLELQQCNYFVQVQFARGRGVVYLIGLFRSEELQPHRCGEKAGREAGHRTPSSNNTSLFKLA